MYYRCVLAAVGRAQKQPTLMFVDNEAAKQVARDPVMNSNMKHVARRHFYAREMEADGEISVARVDTKYNIADALTKAMSASRLRELTAHFRDAKVMAGRALSAMRAAIRGEAEASNDV